MSRDAGRAVVPGDLLMAGDQRGPHPLVVALVTKVCSGSCDRGSYRVKGSHIEMLILTGNSGWRPGEVAFVHYKGHGDVNGYRLMAMENETW